MQDGKEPVLLEKVTGEAAVFFMRKKAVHNQYLKVYIELKEAAVPTMLKYDYFSKEEANRARNTITGFIRRRFKAGKLDWFVETHTEDNIMYLFKVYERSTKRRLVSRNGEAKQGGQQVSTELA